MAKRSNNSLGRRSYGGKPYDANNSFVKKMATKVTDFIPQRSWISKWFNTSEDNGEANDDENLEEGDAEEEIQPPASKRPRIRMDVTHPSGTFAIRRRDKESVNDNHSRKDPYSHINETGDFFLEPPVAGPSGVRRFVSSTPAVATDVRTSNVQRSDLNSLIPSRNIRAINGADDNSESSESTSGCSSLIPQTNRQEAPTLSGYNSNLVSRKRMNDEKLTFANHLQSSRSLFLDSASDSLSSRRPSFNASLMSGTLDRPGSSLSSPFYTGNVTFGGSNALTNYSKRSLFNASNDFQLKVPRRTSVQVKPSSSEMVDSSGMSQTAKRILEAMEYFSSPISDAKKMPVKSPIGGKKRTRDEISSGTTSRVGLRHLTRELSVPTVPEMLKLRRRQKLQDSTLVARKMVSATSGPPVTSAASSTQRPSVVEPDEYRLRTDSDDNSKSHGKLRTKLKASTTKEEFAPLPMVNLPRISLPITSLPSFEPLPKFTKPPCSTSPAKTINDNESFKFASPIKMSESAWNLKSINNFSFSKPLSAEDARDLDDSQEFNKSSKTASVDSNPPKFEAVANNFMFSNSSTAPRLKLKTKSKDKDSISKEKQPTELKTGSVMSILGGKNSIVDATEASQTPNSFVKNSLDIWECTECYIKNDTSEKICVACKASKPGEKKNLSNSLQPPKIAENKPSSEDFGSQFKISSNQWECQSCLVRNQQTAIVCVSCSTPKLNEKKTVQTAAANPMDKFKPIEGSWECPGCMLRNPSNVITCPCCKAAKPSSLKISPAKKESTEKGFADSGLLAKFKPSTNTWECSSCLVRNDENVCSCVCCGGTKPGSTQGKTQKETEKIISNWGDKFKKPANCWSCKTCMIQNKQESNECVACGESKDGTISKPPQFSFGTSGQSFNFGMDKVDEKAIKESTKVSSNGFGFGDKPSSTESVGKFTFGIPKESEIVDKSTENTPKISSFVFAAPKNAAGESGFDIAKKNNNETISDEVKKSTFTFGMPRNPEKENSTSVFGGQAANGKPHIMFDTESKNPPKLTFGGGSIDNSEAKSSSLTIAAPETKRDENPSILPAKTSNETKVSTNFEAPKDNRVSFGFSEINAKPATESSNVFSQNSSTTPSFTAAAVKTNEITAASSTFGVSSLPQVPQVAEKIPEAKVPATSTIFGGIEKKNSFFSMPDAKATFGGDKKSVFTAENKITFGGNDKSAVFNSPAPVFAAPAQPLFGAAAAATATASNSPAPVFGGTSVPSFGNSGDSAGIFAASKSVNSDNGKLFTFGAPASAPAQPAKPPPVFSFGGNPTNTNTPTKPPVFEFGTPGTAQKTPDMFGSNPTNSTFGTQNAPNTTPFTFNAPVKQDTPSFGQPTTNPIPSNMFGAQSTASNLTQTPQASTGFNFGATSQTPATGVFSFGGAMPQPAANAPSSGFTFNAPAISPAIAFDPNTRPTFNFSGGSAPVFNATPQPAQPATTRKIKKAVRRMPQR